MDEEITVEKPENYSELLDIIKNEFLLGDDELEGTIFIFEDQINGGKSKLIPQVFNQFINQENPILFIEVQENSKIYKEALDMSDDLEDINKISNKDNKEEDIKEEDKKEENKKEFNKYQEIIIDQNMLNEIRNEKNKNNFDLNEEPSKEMVISKIVNDTKNRMKRIKEKENEKEKENNIKNSEIEQLENLKNLAQNEENTFTNTINKNKNKETKNTTNKKKEKKINKKENKKDKKQNKKNTKKGDEKEIKKEDEKVDEKKDEKKEEKENKIEDPLDNKFFNISEDLIRETIMSTSKITNSNISTAVHKDIKCNGCGMESIYGIRYKCTMCPNFNFCAICENNKEHEHPFLKIKFPML